MKKLNWYLNRLSLMTPAEIIGRTKEELHKKIDRITLKEPQAAIELEDRAVQWYFDVHQRKEMQAALLEYNLFNGERARELLDNKYTFFSLDKEYFSEEIDWHKDYKNGVSAPLKYCKDIDYRDYQEVGDYKFTWELNRHQHLVTLAKAYYVTGSDKYKDKVIKQIDSWIDANPYKMGLNWESTLELAVRLISWSWVWTFIGADHLDQEFKDKWLSSIYKHMHYTANHFSRYSSANNHLIGEAAGLFIASVVWPFKGAAVDWQKKSFDMLVREMDKQNYEDGVNKEQATSYQQFVLDFFLLSGLLGEKNGIEFPTEYWQRIEQMMVFIGSIMDRDGNMPNIGDNDDGYAVILSEEGFNPFQSLLATGAVICKRGDFKQKSTQFDEKSFWLLGIDGLKQFESINPENFVTQKKFEQGGYYILSNNDGKDNEVKAIFDCGPLGFLSIAAHGHCDALSFTLSVGGKPIIIDPGTYSYNTYKEWRQYFRCTSAHNTIVVDGQDQSVSGGNFMWMKKAQSFLESFESNTKRDVVKGYHNGYHRLKGKVTHQREISFDKEKFAIIIKDCILTKGKHKIDQYFHFDKDCKVEEYGKILRISNQHQFVCMEVDQAFESKIYTGSTNPISGWDSRGFDRKEVSNTLVNSAEVEGAAEFTTVVKIN